jgi:hypothetical protein
VGGHPTTGELGIGDQVYGGCGEGVARVVASQEEESVGQLNMRHPMKTLSNQIGQFMGILRKGERE